MIISFPLANYSVRIEPVEMQQVNTSTSSARTDMGLFIKRLNRALQLHRQRVALAVNLFAHGNFDPPLADAIFLHIKALFVVEFDADIVLKNGSHMKWATSVSGEVVRESGFSGFGHGEILLNEFRKGVIFYYLRLNDTGSLTEEFYLIFCKATQ